MYTFKLFFRFAFGCITPMFTVLHLAWWLRYWIKSQRFSFSPLCIQCSSTNQSRTEKEKHWESLNIYHNPTDAFQYIHKKVRSFKRKQRNKYHTRAILGALGFAAGASQRQTPPTGSYLSFLCVKWFNYLLSSRQEIRDFMYEVFCRGRRREQAP